MIKVVLEAGIGGFCLINSSRIKIHVIVLIILVFNIPPQIEVVFSRLRLECKVTLHPRVQNLILSHLAPVSVYVGVVITEPRVK